MAVEVRPLSERIPSCPRIPTEKDHHETILQNTRTTLLSSTRIAVEFSFASRFQSSRADLHHELPGPEPFAAAAIHDPCKTRREWRVSLGPQICGPQHLVRSAADRFARLDPALPEPVLFDRREPHRFLP